MDSAPSPFAHEDIFAKLRMLMRALHVALGGCGLAPLVAIATYQRVSRTFLQIERMLVRFRAGKLRIVLRRGAVPKPVAIRRTPAMALPRRFGWLLRAGKHVAACQGSHLQILLNAPEMVALVAASAQARRILRPLCRALAVELPWTVDKPRLERGVMRRRKPRPKPEPFRIPLPRGVLTAARRQGFGKMR